MHSELVLMVKLNGRITVLLFAIILLNLVHLLAFALKEMVVLTYHGQVAGLEIKTFMDKNLTL